eukprot:scaffold1253_cov245-Pinguiococcus_pyrenoidosus.AAC.26
MRPASTTSGVWWARALQVMTTSCAVSSPPFPGLRSTCAFLGDCRWSTDGTKRLLTTRAARCRHPVSSIGSCTKLPPAPPASSSLCPTSVVAKETRLEADSAWLLAWTSLAWLPEAPAASAGVASEGTPAGLPADPPPGCSRYRRPPRAELAAASERSPAPAARPCQIRGYLCVLRLQHGHQTFPSAVPWASGAQVPRTSPAASPSRLNLVPLRRH